MTRLDRGAYTIPVWFGLFFTGLYVLTQPQIESGIPNWVENVLGLVFALGAGACLVGAFMGTRWFYPKATLSLSYWLEIAGLSVICVVLGVLAIVTDLSLEQQFTMSGGLGALVQIGSLVLIARLAVALRHEAKQPTET